MNVLVIALDATVPIDTPEAEVLVVAPALNSRLRHWLSDDAGARREAEERLAACLVRLEHTRAYARGSIGDADVLQAIAVPVFDAEAMPYAA